MKKVKPVTLEEIQKHALAKHGRRLTMKQAQFVKVVAETNNPTEAARRVYQLGRVHKGRTPTEEEAKNTSKAMGSENMAKPYIRETVEAIANRVGLTKEFVMAALQDDIEAKPRMRARELELAGKWLQLEKPPTTNVLAMSLSDEQADRILGLN